MQLLIPIVKVLEGINFVVVAVTMLFVGGATAYVAHSDYSYKVEQIARLETAQIEAVFQEVTVRVHTGGSNLCGLQGTYRVEIEMIATIDLEDVIKNGNILSHRWDNLPEPNITTAYAKSVKPLSETTNFGCRVSFDDARQLAKTVALVRISQSAKYQDLLVETKEATLASYSELTGVAKEDITFYDNDKGRTFAVDIPNPPCWGITDNGDFIKTC